MPFRWSFVKYALLVGLGLAVAIWYLSSYPAREVERFENDIQNASADWETARQIAKDAIKQKHLPPETKLEDIRAWEKIIGACGHLAQTNMMGATLNSGIPMQNDIAKQQIQSDYNEFASEKADYLAVIRKSLETLATKPYFAEQVSSFQTVFDQTTAVMREKNN